jgi:hypothetical protein
MKTLRVKFPLTPEFKNGYVTINPAKLDITINLENGAHTVTTDLMDVGTRGDYTLQAKLTFWYSYEELTNILTLCGNDYVSADCMYLTTVLKGTEQSCHQHTFPEDDTACGNNTDWNYCHPEITALKELLLETVRQANTMLIAYAEKDYTVLELTPLADLPDDLVNELNAVYRNGKFLELHNPETKYTANDAVFNIKSVFGGTIYLQPTDTFVTVIGSTNDPKIQGQPWKRLWENQFGICNNCTSNGMPDFTCSPNIVGAHLTMGTVPTTVPMGSNSVFIMPICTRHNNYNGYMKPLVYRTAIALRNYMGT